MRKFTTYDESTVSHTSDHTEIKHYKEAPPMFWVLIIAFAFCLLVAACMWVMRDSYPFEQHSEIKK